MKSQFRWQPVSLALVLFASHLPGRMDAATFVVYKNSDDGSAGTLRYAIQNNNVLGGGNTIVFSNNVPGTITLTSGELFISNNLTLQGPGANLLTVSGNNASRVFDITNATVAIYNLTIANGAANTLGGGAGGGIRNLGGRLSLYQCNVSGCFAGNGSSSSGGGIYNSLGSVFLSSCTISSNSVSSNGQGGGVSSQHGSAEMLYCTFSGNSAPGGNGGGVCNVNGPVYVNLCTFAGNSSSLGGAIQAGNGNDLTIYDTTISSNTGSSTGGGIFVGGGAAAIGNTIVAGNNTGGTGPDCAGTFSSGGFNLIGARDGSTGWGALGDQTGTTNAPINPLLGPLQDNGGPTFTMALLPGSPAIDQGTNAHSYSSDQRPRSRPFTNNPAASFLGDGSDIGAYEVSPVSLFVTTNSDSGPGSLRQTLTDAGGTDGDLVIFAGVVTGAITLTSGELATAKTVNVLGPGPQLLAINGNNAGRVLHVLSAGNVLLAGLGITGGSNGYVGGTFFNQLGGGIFNEGKLTVSNCLVSGNHALSYGGGLANGGVLSIVQSLIASNTAYDGDGGGLYNLQATTNPGSGTLTVANSTFFRNNAGPSLIAAGGGIKNDGGIAYLVNSTICSNAAPSYYGGGVDNAGTLMITNCTISANQALNAGGINSGGTTVIVRNTIVAGNMAANFGPDCYNPFTSAGFNFIGKSDGSTGFTNGVNQDQVGTVASPIDPALEGLNDNGGPTPTMALLVGGPAMDKGNSSGFATDQRGQPRPFAFPWMPRPAGGDGSDIGAFEFNPPILGIAHSPGQDVLFWPYYFRGWAVMSTTNLGPQAPWALVPVVPVTIGTQSYVTNTPAGPKTFYRLVPVI